MTATPPLAVHVADVALAHTPLPAEQVVEGAPSTAAHELWRAPAGSAVSAGIWEISEGVSTDVEADELFVVISGRATIAFADGRVVEAGPGDAVELRAGDRTTWTVHERLRKVYIVAE